MIRWEYFGENAEQRSGGLNREPILLHVTGVPEKGRFGNTP